MHNAEGKCAFQTFNAGHNRLFQRMTFFIFAVNQVNRRFGIRFGMEMKTFAFQFVSQAFVIFNNAVVNQNQLAVIGKVRVGVLD